MKRRMSVKLLAAAGAMILALSGPAGRCIDARASEDSSKAPGKNAVSETNQPDYLLTYRDLPDIEVPSVKDVDGKYPTALKTNLEPSYIPDLATLPAVRNQNPYGTCWAHSAMALGELSIMKQEMLQLDLSELQYAYFCYQTTTDPLGGTYGDVNEVGRSDVYQKRGFLELGGNLYLSLWKLASWVGAADEADVPYSNAADVAEYGLDKSYAFDYDIAHLRNAFVVNLHQDQDAVKNLIMTYGGAGTSYYEDFISYSSEYNSYYQSTATTTNHGVTIVGWDDNFPKENFLTQPEGNGAWLIRNSWGGSGYSHEGYFWISYYDTSLDANAYAFDFVSSENEEYYDNNYQYDGGIYGYEIYDTGNPNALVAASVFTAQKSAETLKAVNFGTSSTNLSYVIDIYKNLTDTTNPTSGTKVSTTTGKTLYAGAITVPLTTEVTLKAGDVFSVVITLEGENGATICVEADWDGWAYVDAYSEAGQSFLSAPNSGSWMDYGGQGEGNIRIKALTNTTSEEKTYPTGISFEDGTEVTVGVEVAKRLKVTLSPSDVTERSLTWTSGNEQIASVDQYGNVTGHATGTTTITATSGDGRCSASIKVHVVTVYDSITADSLSLEIGSKKKVTLRTSPASVTETLTWTSDDPSVATVDQNGVVTAVGIGMTVITVSGIKATCQIPVAVNYPTLLSVNAERCANNDVLVTYPVINGTVTVTLYRYGADGKMLNSISVSPTEGEYLDLRGWDTAYYKLFYESYYEGMVATYSTQVAPIRMSFSSMTSSCKGILLQWNAGTTAETYNVYRRSENGGWDKITSVSEIGEPSYSYLDTSVVEGTKYYYALEAVRQNLSYNEVAEGGTAITATGGHRVSDSGTPYMNSKSKGVRVVCKDCGETFEQVDTSFTSLGQAEDGNWYYYVKGVVDNSYTGLCQYNGSWWYVEKGKVNFNATTLCLYSGTWWYVEKGKVNFNATTLCLYSGTWWYVEKGKVNFNATTLCQYSGTWWYVEKGKVNFNATTLCQYSGTWWYVQKGKVNFGATTLCQYSGTWWYVEKGKVNFNATTLCQYGGTWWYVQKGKVNFGATTLCQYGGTWWYVQKGKVNFGATTLCQYGGSWWYVEKGKVNFNATTLCYFGGSWWYVEKGKVNFSATTLCKYGNTWYYVEKGKVNFKFSGMVTYRGAKYRVVNGVVKF